MTHRSLLVLALFTAPSLAWPQTEGRYDVVVEKDVMVPSRDGVGLATDVYRPAIDGAAIDDALPVLLQRTPYGKHGERFAESASFFASHGYVVALQDMRGRFGSEGAFSKYHDFDVTDGYDTVEWLAKLPYTTGRVGMWGTSYGAHTQADAAKSNPPSLGPLILNQGGMSNAWDHAVRHGGAFELARELTWAFRYIPAETKDSVVKEAFARENVLDWYGALPIRPGTSPLALAPNFEAYFLAEATTSDYGPFWTRPGRNWVEYYDETADVPMLHVGGWFDIFLRGTIRNYVELARLKSSAIRLLVGPWTHSGNARTYAGDVDFGPEAAIEDFGADFHLRWYDHFLKGEPTGVEAEAPVRLFVMGTGDGQIDENGRLLHGGYWRDADAWPLPESRETAFYFHADGTLRAEPPQMDASSTTYVHDPSRPVPTLGGAVSSRVKDGAYDQRARDDFAGSRPPYLPLKSRADVVVFQTEPLEHDVTVIGPIEVRLYASSTAVDTDFTAKLIDVYPPSEDFPSGFDMNLTDALVRASYRDDRTARDLIVPGQVYELVIRPFATANVFKKGHRIRVDIASSNFPRFDVNPGTGEPLGQHRRSVRADNTIYHDGPRPSRVVLWTLPE